LSAQYVDTCTRATERAGLALVGVGATSPARRRSRRAACRRAGRATVRAPLRRGVGAAGRRSEASAPTPREWRAKRAISTPRSDMMSIPTPRVGTVRRRSRHEWRAKRAILTPTRSPHALKPRSDVGGAGLGGWGGGARWARAPQAAGGGRAGRVGRGGIESRRDYSNPCCRGRRRRDGAGGALGGVWRPLRRVHAGPPDGLPWAGTCRVRSRGSAYS